MNKLVKYIGVAIISLFLFENAVSAAASAKCVYEGDITIILNEDSSVNCQKKNGSCTTSLTSSNFINSNGKVSCPNSLYLKGNNQMVKSCAYVEINSGNCVSKSLNSVKSTVNGSNFEERKLLNTCPYDKIKVNFYSDGTVTAQNANTSAFAVNVINFSNVDFKAGCPKNSYIKSENNNFTISFEELSGYELVTLGNASNKPSNNLDSDDYQEKEWPLLESDTFCTRSSSVWQLVGYVLYAAKIIIPVIIMILGVVDFVKAIFLSDEKSVQKAGITLLQRAIMGVAIFFVPTLVSLVIGLVSDMAEAKEKVAGCETCLLRPTSPECKNIKDAAKALREQNNG